MNARLKSFVPWSPPELTAVGWAVLEERHQRALRELDPDAHQRMLNDAQRRLNDIIRVHAFTCTCAQCMTAAQYKADQRKQQKLGEK